MDYILEVSHVRKVYRMGDEKIVALDDISLQFERGKIYCLVGVSGSGKSTLLNMMAGLEKPTRGSIVFFGKVHVEKMDEKRLALFRQKYIGFVFQSYNLISTLTAEENVMLPLIFHNAPRRVRKKKAMQMLKAVGLANRRRHKPAQMSGGQQQRVSIARAYANDPQLVFADEPTGNLDTKTTKEMMDLIVGMAKTHNQTLLIVTHNMELAIYADQIIHIRDGNIERIENRESALKEIEAMEKYLRDETDPQTESPPYDSPIQIPPLPSEDEPFILTDITPDENPDEKTETTQESQPAALT
jgi:putative ABC transport system ATP-binding protein